MSLPYGGAAAADSNTAAFLVGRVTGDSVVWKDTSGEFTYGDLRARAAVIADAVAASRESDEPVALLAGNGIMWIAAYLAVLASGRVVVPLATTLSGHEAAARARWAGCRTVLLGRDQSEKSTELRIAGLDIVAESDVDPPAGGAPVLRYTDVDPDADAAYLFTSGTTAAPRAVRLSHRNLQANTTSILSYLPLRSDDRILVALPFTYVFGASLLHTHLRLGATLVGHATPAFPETTVARLGIESCTGFAGVPSLFNALVRNSSFTTASLPSLRTIQQAGGALSESVLQELVDAQPQARVFVMYGQTEATARLSYLPPTELHRRRGSIGKGIPGVRLTVVGEDGTATAPGEVGEILAMGENVSPGYLHDAAATRAKMPDGVLHTGDLATVDADGYIYIVDRSDDFIKSWGHRVASIDVEAVVMALPAVVAAAAVGITDPAAGERVELAIVLRPDAELTPAEVLAHCRTMLTGPLVPAHVHLLDELPLNANGKVVKREVRAMLSRLDARSTHRGET